MKGTYMKRWSLALLMILAVSSLGVGCNEPEATEEEEAPPVLANLAFANGDNVEDAPTYWLCTTEDPDEPQDYIRGGNLFSLVLANNGTGYRHNWSFTWKKEGEDLNYHSPRAKKEDELNGSFGRFEGSVGEGHLDFVDSIDGREIDVSCELNDY